MSLGIAIKAPEGLVLAVDSRLTLIGNNADVSSIAVHFDNATKLLSFSKPNDYIGVVTYGQAVIGLRTAQSFVPEFESALLGVDAPPQRAMQRLSVHEFATRLSAFYRHQWQASMPAEYTGPDMTFLVAGFDDGAPYGKLFEINIPRKPDPFEHYGVPGAFGIVWGGQREIVDRLIQGVDGRLRSLLLQMELPPEAKQQIETLLGQIPLPIPLLALPLQDCIDLAIFFIKTTISAHNLSLTIRGVGGPIDVAIITRTAGLQFVQRKVITGEQQR